MPLEIALSTLSTEHALAESYLVGCYGNGCCYTGGIQIQVVTTLPFLPPATKLRQGNVFTPVCHSVHRGRGSLSGGLCLGGLCPRVSVQGCPLFGGSLSVGFLSGCLCPGVSVSRWVSIQGDNGGNEWAVRILLECILVLSLIYGFPGHKFKI